MQQTRGHMLWQNAQLLKKQEALLVPMYRKVGKCGTLDNAMEMMNIRKTFGELLVICQHFLPTNILLHNTLVVALLESIPNVDNPEIFDWMYTLTHATLMKSKSDDMNNPDHSTYYKPWKLCNDYVTQ